MLHRYTRIVATAFLSKAMLGGAQILSAPLILSSLGAGGYALYSMLLSAAAWLGLSSLGIGPILREGLKNRR